MSSQTYEVAHIQEQGQDMVIIPVSSSFAHKSIQEQSEIEQSLQYCAANAGLRGTVCVVWTTGSQFNFRAPKQWHAFFRTKDMNFVAANINRKLTCALG